MPDPDSMIPGTAHTYRELGQCFTIDPSKVDDVIRRNGASTARQVHDAARALINRPLGFQIMAECARHGTGMNWDSIRNPSQRELDALRVQMTNDLHMWLSRSDDLRLRSNHCRRSVIDGMVTKMLDNIAFDTLEQSNFRLAVLAFEFLKCQPPAFQTEWAKQWTRDNIESYTGTLERFTADDISCPGGIFERLFLIIANLYPGTVSRANNHMRRKKLLAWLKECYNHDSEGFTVERLRRYISEKIARQSDDHNPADWAELVEAFVEREGKAMAGGYGAHLPTSRYPHEAHAPQYQTQSGASKRAVSHHLRHRGEPKRRSVSPRVKRSSPKSRLMP
jgi:hypothetical protein